MQNPEPGGLLSDYGYDLPASLIASRPLENRDASRMLVLHRASGVIEHRAFRDFREYLQPGDLAVLNNSRVIKARLLTPDHRTELFLLEKIRDRTWKCMARPGKRTRAGMDIEIAGTVATVLDIFPGGERLVEFREEPDLETHGVMPIPPYFKRDADAEDAVRYQTVFANSPGSVAAPTAGLHFTPEMLARIPHATVTLHVGAGTFQPVKVERLADHAMHEERYEISAQAASAINAAKRIVAIGTTSARVLESQPKGPVRECQGSTRIFIHPPYQFRRIDALLTNFHLPHSTLLMLISAFAEREMILDAYAVAVAEKYRFFSYGDCMLIL